MRKEKIHYIVGRRSVVFKPVALSASYSCDSSTSLLKRTLLRTLERASPYDLSKTSVWTTVANCGFRPRCKAFFAPPTRADRLKIFTLNQKDRLLVAP